MVWILVFSLASETQAITGTFGIDRIVIPFDGFAGSSILGYLEVIKVSLFTCFEIRVRVLSLVSGSTAFYTCLWKSISVLLGFNISFSLAYLAYDKRIARIFFS